MKKYCNWMRFASQTEQTNQKSKIQKRQIMIWVFAFCAGFVSSLFYCYRGGPCFFFFFMWSGGYKIYLHVADRRANMCIPWGAIGSCLCAFKSVLLVRLAFRPNALVSRVILWAYISKHVNIRTKKKKIMLSIFWVCGICFHQSHYEIQK